MNASKDYWLPVLPAQWQRVPAWFLFTEGTERAHAADVHLTPSRKYGVIPQAKYAELSGHRPIANDATAGNMKKVYPDDFIISMGSFESGIEHSTIPGKVSNDYRVLRPTGYVEPRYFRWFLKSSPLIDALDGLTGEIRVGQRIHYSQFSRLSLPLPELATQRRIADYLDRETAQIDAMVGALDGLVSRLEERRSSLSRQHIETARENYSFTQVKFLADITTGTGDTQDATETGYPFYVRSNTPVFSSDWEFEGDAVLTAGDGAGVGRVYHLATGRFRAHQRVYVIHNFRAITPEYFLHVFRALFPDTVLSGSAQTTVPSVRLHMISDLKIPLPPLDEQRRIADHLDAETAKIDAMIAKAGELRALLDERRSALITATVTGQHPVPEEH